MATKVLVVFMLLVAGANLRGAIEGDDKTAADRLALVALSVMGISVGWPHVSKERPE